MKKSIHMYDVRFDNVTMQQTLTHIDEFIKGRKKGYVVTPNVDHVININKDAYLKKIYERSELSLADGMPLIWASKLFRKPLVEKVSGSDLLVELLPFATSKKYKVFFLGAEENASQKAIEKIKSKYPKIKIVGRYSPPLLFEKDAELNKEIVKRVNDARPDLLLVFLSHPRQEKWIYENMPRLKVNLSLCLGASLDFIAGDVKRAPKWMQRTGTEWVWRLISEPRRMFKRYIINDLVPFTILTWKEFRKPSSKDTKNDCEIANKTYK